MSNFDMLAGRRGGQMERLRDKYAFHVSQWVIRASFADWLLFAVYPGDSESDERLGACFDAGSISHPEY